MYKINVNNTDRLNCIKITSYSQILGLSSTILSLLFNGKATTKLSTAKGILSIAYNIPVTDEKMEELLEKHFTKVK